MLDAQIVEAASMANAPAAPAAGVKIEGWADQGLPKIAPRGHEPERANNTNARCRSADELDARLTQC